MNNNKKNKKYRINYSMDVNKECIVKAKDEKEAKSKFYALDYDIDTEESVDDTLLGINNIEEIE